MWSHCACKNVFQVLLEAQARLERDDGWRSCCTSRLGPIPSVPHLRVGCHHERSWRTPKPRRMRPQPAALRSSSQARFCLVQCPCSTWAIDACKSFLVKHKCNTVFYGTKGEAGLAENILVGRQVALPASTPSRRTSSIKLKSFHMPSVAAVVNAAKGKITCKAEPTVRDSKVLPKCTVR